MTPTGEQIAWAAGLFEGEGCITSIKKQTKVGTSVHARLILNMTDLDVVERFVEIVGGNKDKIRRVDRGKNKLQYVWECTRRDEVFRIFFMLSPWLGTRRQETGMRLLSQVLQNGEASDH